MAENPWDVSRAGYSEDDYCAICGHELVGAPCGDKAHTTCWECDGSKCVRCDELRDKVELDVMDEEG